MKKDANPGIDSGWINRSVRSKDACFGQVTYPPGGYYGPRIQPDFELVVIHSGDCNVLLNGEQRHIPPGSVALFLPGNREHYHFSIDRETHHSWISVAPRCMPPTLARELKKAAFVAAPSEVFNRLFSAGLVMGTSHTPAAERVITQLAVLLFAEFLHLTDAGRTGKQQPKPLRKALSYMEDHFADEHCLTGTLRASGVSRNAIIRHFTQELGLPPARYLWRLRTEHGISMLAKTGLTISEIAYQCGFKTPFHFSRLVRQHQGCPPRTVRKQAWKQ